MGGITLTKDDRGDRAGGTGPDAADPDGTAPPSPGGPPGPTGHPDRTDRAPAPSPRRLAVVLSGLVLAVLLAALQQLGIATALPAIAADLPGSTGRAPWAVTAYLLTATASLPLYGKLGDLYGRKGMLLFALVLFVAGTALAGWARSLNQLVAFRAVQGLGAGGILTGVQAVAADLAPARRRGRPLGLLGAAFAVGSAAGPLFGGHIAELTSWRWSFHLTVPLGLLAIAVVGAALRLPAPARRARPDILGALLLTAATSCVILLIAWGGTQYAWNSRVVLGLACGAAGTGLLYLVVAYWAPEPVVPLRLLRDPLFLVTALLGAVLGVALFGVATFLPVLLQQASASGTLHTGVLILPLLGALTVASLLSGHLIGRTGHYAVYAVIGAAVATVGMWLISRLDADTPRLDHSIWQAVLGTGIGLVLPVLVLAVQNAAPPADLGAATGAHTLFRQIGACAGVTLLGTLLAEPHALPPALRSGYAQTYADAAPRILLHLVPVLALGLLVAFFLKGKPLVPDAHPGAGSVPPARTPGSVPPPPAAQPAAAPGASAPPPPASPHGPTPAPGAPHGTGAPICGTVRHHDGSHVPGAALTLVDAHGRQTGRGTSGPDGRYALSTPGPGAYVLIASAGGHRPHAVTVTVGVPSDKPVERDLVLGGAGRVTGTVTASDGRPLHDAAVTLTDGRGDVVATARTGPDGSYTLTELVAGAYTLTVGAATLRPTALPVSVHADRETHQDVELAGEAVLHGTVRALGGRPLEEARVTLVDAAGNVVDTLTTGPDGIFRFVDLMGGAYTVIASGYPPNATALQVAGGGRTEHDVHLHHDN